MSAPPPVESLEDVRARHAQRFWKTYDEPAMRNERSECGRGLSAPTESNVISHDHRGAEAPPTFNGYATVASAAHSLPSLVLTHGLLATLALAKARGGALRTLMLEVCRFLCDPERALLPPPSPKQERDDELDPYLRLLTDGNDATSLQLQRATAEALTYLATLKRVAPKAV
ncbi:MAG: hypothetical protein FJ388_06820 [Verrucomicrobia bacterium]|nr:hypothetical protein [Verrucomicrobiota bacterium]